MNSADPGKELQSKQRILAAAVTLFARQGFDRTGMRELAREAEVNLAMINYFFGSKKHLLTEILETFFSEYLTIARIELNGGGELKKRLKQFIAHSVRFFAERQDYLLIALTDLHNDDAETIEYKAMWGRQMVEIMEQSVCGTAGLNIDPKLMTPLLTSMMASRFLFSPVIERIESGDIAPPDIEIYTQMITDIFLQGVIES